MNNYYQQNQYDSKQQDIDYSVHNPEENINNLRNCLKNIEVFPKDSSSWVKFSAKTGKYLIGENEASFPEDGLMVDIHNIMQGFNYWRGLTLQQSVSWKIHEPQKAVTIDQLPYCGPKESEKDGWKAFFTLSFLDSKGIRYNLSMNSRASLIAVKEFLNELQVRLQNNEPCVPIVFLRSHKVGTQGNYAPDLLIIKWNNPDVLEAARVLNEANSQSQRQAPVQQPQPYQQAPVQQGQPYQQAPVQQGQPYQQAPVQQGQPYQQAPVQQGQPYQQAPVQQAPVQQGQPYQQAPVRQGQPYQKDPNVFDDDEIPF